MLKGQIDRDGNVVPSFAQNFTEGLRADFAVSQMLTHSDKLCGAKRASAELLHPVGRDMISHVKSNFFPIETYSTIVKRREFQLTIPPVRKFIFLLSFPPESVPRRGTATCQPAPRSRLNTLP